MFNIALHYTHEKSAYTTFSQKLTIQMTPSHQDMRILFSRLVAQLGKYSKIF